MRWALACKGGLRMSCQSMSSSAKKRKAPRVSPQPPQAAGMLGVGCRLKVSASFTCRRFRRLSPRSRSANSSCAQLIRSIFSSKNQQLTAESSRCVQSDDLNPIEKFFSKLKALLRKAEQRTVDGLWNTIGRLLDCFTPQELSNYFSSSGHVST